MDNIWRDRFWERDNAQEGAMAWHRLGKQGDPTRKMTVLQSMEEADVLYGVVTQPQYFRDPDTNELVQSEQVAIVRPAWKGEPLEVYGYASNQYQPLQNHEMARLLERIADTWPVETVGAIRRGADLFVTLDAGRKKIGKDEIRQFFFVWNSHDGNSALRVRVTPVRVVCQNTCIIGDRKATISLDVRHTRRILQEAEFAFDLVGALRKAEDGTMAALTELTKIHLTVAQVADVFNSVYPVRETTSNIRTLESNFDNLTDEQKTRLNVLKANLERDRAVMLQRQLAALERFDVFNQEHKSFALTGWAAYNAVTELECHRKGGTDEQLAASVLMGDRAATMAKAYEALVSLR